MLSSIIPWCSKLCRFILPKRTKTQIKCTQKRGWNADKNAVKTHTKTRLKCTQNAYENSSKNCQARSLFLQQYFVRAFLKLVSASSEQQERASLNSIQRLLRWNEREREKKSLWSCSDYFGLFKGRRFAVFSFSFCTPPLLAAALSTFGPIKGANNLSISVLPFSNGMVLDKGQRPVALCEPQPRTNKIKTDKSNLNFFVTRKK